MNQMYSFIDIYPPNYFILSHNRNQELISIINQQECDFYDAQESWLLFDNCKSDIEDLKQEITTFQSEIAKYSAKHKENLQDKLTECEDNIKTIYMGISKLNVQIDSIQQKLSQIQSILQQTINK